MERETAPASAKGKWQKTAAAPPAGAADTIAPAADEAARGKRLAARASLQLASEQGFLTGFGYIASIVLAWGLGPERFGLYGVVISFLNWAEQTAKLGIPTATTKLVAEGGERAHRIEETALGVGVAFLLVIFIVLLAAAPVLAGIFKMPDHVNLFRLAALDVPFYGTLFLYRGIAMGRHRFRIVPVAGVLYSSARLVGVLVMLVVGFSLPGALWAYLAGAPVGGLFLASRLRVRFRGPAGDAARELVRISVPLALGAFGLSILHNLDLWTLKALAPEGAERALGLYYASRLLAKVPEVALVPVAGVLFPLMSRALAGGNVELAQSYTEGAVRFLWVGFLPIVLFVAVEAEGILGFLFSSAYAGGANYLRLLVFAYMLLAFLVIAFSVLRARGDFYLTVWMGFGLVALLATLAAVLIPTYAAAGAAIAFLTTAGVGATVSAVLVARRIGALLRFPTFLRGGLGAAALALVASWIPTSGVLLAVEGAALLGLYALGLTIAGELKRKDYEALLFWRR